MAMWWDIPWYENVVEAATENAFEAGWSGSTHPDPNHREESYDRDYQPLERRIRRALQDNGIPDSGMDIWGPWVPNRTREVAVESKYATSDALIALHRLLNRKYADWRIDVRLVKSIEEMDLRGAVSIRKNWVLCFGSGRKLIDKLRKTLK